MSKDEDLAAKIDIQTLHLKESPGIKIEFEYIFEGTIRTVNTYYVCNGCGHVYWEGPHWQSLTTRFAHVLNLDQNDSQFESKND